MATNHPNIVDQWILLSYSRIADNLYEYLPNLESIILTGNNIQDFGDLDPLLQLPKLETLSLLTNPITTDPHYREYIAYKWAICAEQCYALNNSNYYVCSYSVLR